MKILILHRIPYEKIEYHRGIPHEEHEIFYIGTEQALANVPSYLPCQKIVRPGQQSVSDEVATWLSHSKICFDVIISMSEYELLNAAYLREKFNIRGPKSTQVEWVRNKVLMKQAVMQVGLRVPSFANAHIWLQGGFMHQGPVVIKPLRGASSENIILCSSSDVAKQIVQKSPIFNADQYEIEEYIEGDILHIDGLVFKGKIIACIASQYVGDCLAYSRGLPLGSVQLNTTNEITEWAGLCVQAVHIKQGSFHLEAIRNNGSYIFLEIANRVGGADVVKTFELATGIHLPTEELKMVVQGDQYQIPAFKVPEQYYGWFVFPGHHLTSLYSCNLHTGSFKDHPMVLEWHELALGQPCKKHITYQPTEVPLAGTLLARKTEEMMEFLHRLFNTVKTVNRDPNLAKEA